MNIWYDLIDRVTGKAPTGAKRNPSWYKIRNTYLKDHPDCAVCRKTKGVEVHHIIPFFIAPDLELNIENLITLCRRHHKDFGHCGLWRSFNLTIESDAAQWRIKFDKARGN